MSKYVSHVSALLYWEVPYSWLVFGCKTEEELRCKFRPEVSFTPKSPRQNSSSRLKAHVVSVKLPKSAITKCGDMFVSSPELVFAELAHELEFEKLLLLGLLLCGHAPGANRRVLTTAAKIRNFVQGVVRMRGINKAILAAKYLKDGAASAHEAILYMLLTLPQRYGGYGLAGCEFNVKIDIPNEYKTVAGRKCFYADLCWRKMRLVVEYDSRSYHDNEDSWVSDSRKEKVLKAMGYSVESINTSLLYSKSALDISARVIARAIGGRIRIENKAYAHRRLMIMSLLPHL